MRGKSQKVSSDYRPTIQSVGRGLQLLDHVVVAGKPVALGQLAELLGLERSSVHRLMATLIAYGYIIQDASKRYVPGPAIMELASKVSSREQIHDIAGSYLVGLAEKTGEAAHMAVLGRDGVVFTNCVASNYALSVISRVGESEPIYCTALGKALVCEMEKDNIKELLRNCDLKKHTDGTIYTVEAFVKECNRVKVELLAKDDEEFRLGIRCLAAPVKNFSGNIVAAIGISGPKSRLNDKQFKETGEIVKETGIELSKRLGFVFDE